MAKKHTNNRTALLDVAEELFADHGFDGVSVRAITDKANSRLASINYYFESKENLFYEVIRRRATSLNTDRESELAKIDFTSADTRANLRKLVEAFILPLTERSLSGDFGWKNYGRLIAQTSTLRAATAKRSISMLDPTAKQFLVAIETCFEGIGNRRANYCFQFMLSSTLGVFSENGRLEHLSEGKYSSEDRLEEICHDLIDFVVGGIWNVVARATK